MDVHKESISIALRNAAGKIVMECVIETKASMILQFSSNPAQAVILNCDCNAGHRSQDPA
jgi:hypothetical protein